MTTAEINFNLIYSIHIAQFQSSYHYPLTAWTMSGVSIEVVEQNRSHAAVVETYILERPRMDRIDFSTTSFHLHHPTITNPHARNQIYHLLL